MVFCKLSKKLKSRLESAEDAIENSASISKKVVNTHISSGLNKIDRHKSKLSSRIKDKIAEKKKYINEKIIEPHIEKRKKNTAMMLYVDISLTVVVCMFLYKLYPFLKKIMNTTDYTPAQLENATKLPEDAYSREDLRKVNEFRKSFADWLEYYKSEDAFSETNVGIPEIRRGNDLREPFKFVIQYIIPYVIIAYIVWFVVKYIKFVIAAIWSFFVTVYQFVTKKITCKLAEKWYIRMGTGWSRCHPKFNQYVDRWKNQYVIRPVVTERITYLRAVETAKVSYNKKFGSMTMFDIFMSWINWFWEWLYSLKYKLFDLPLEELYLQLRYFHPTYVVKPYDISAKDRGDEYSSKTRKGKVCKCPPRKTVYKKMSEYISKTTCKSKRIKSKLVKSAKDTHNTIKTTRNKSNKTISNLLNNIKSLNIQNPLGGACINEPTPKTVAQGVWTSLMILTICVVVYSLMYNKNILGKVYKFSNPYNYTLDIPNSTRYMLLTYFGVFFSLGYYGFLH